jgi:CRP-like cAMP-binding protein
MGPVCSRANSSSVAPDDKKMATKNGEDQLTLEEAKDEINRLRQQLEALKADASGAVPPSAASTSAPAPNAKKNNNARAAVVATRAAGKDYVKRTIPKSDSVRKLIYDAIKSNTLFRACSEEELVDLIDAFDSADYAKGSTVIKQGDEGEHFFVVEEGSLDITVRTVPEEGTGSNGDAGARGSEVKVGVPYVAGSAFGELALMYGSPRAATIRATQDCKLWSIDRTAFKGITSQHKVKRSELHLQFLRKVKIGDKVLGDVLQPDDINAMALATQQDTFAKGDVIVREGERGDVFYLIESGEVEVFKKGEDGDGPIATLGSGQFFGERALLSEDLRQATCVASSDVKCLYLMREDFVLMLGNLQDLLDGKSAAAAAAAGDDDGGAAAGSAPANKDGGSKDDPADDSSDEIVKYDLGDLETKQTLGIGAFGRVKLVTAKGKNGKTKSYALKCLAKTGIVENGLQDHVLNEKEIMEELNHPFILSFHCAMQDQRNIYFLLEVLRGGELFKFLRAENQFPESWSRFYAASVVLAFCQIHARKIAYRDLKPENLVMDADGYLKVVDFGLAKKVENGKLWTLCGTPDYLAPEVILNEGHDWAVDYWALGVLIYEMTAGAPPFYAEDPMQVYEQILSGTVHMPSHFSRSLCDIIKKLLKSYQSKRLGRTKGGCAAIMKQKWFSGFDWEALMHKEMDVPIKPSTTLEDNFDRYDDAEEEEPRACGWHPML